MSFFASEGSSPILCAPGWSLFDTRLRGEVLPKFAASLPLCMYISSPSIVKFHLTKLVSKDEFLGQNSRAANLEKDMIY